MITNFNAFSPNYKHKQILTIKMYSNDYNQPNLSRKCYFFLYGVHGLQRPRHMTFRGYVAIFHTFFKKIYSIILTYSTKYILHENHVAVILYADDSFIYIHWLNSIWIMLHSLSFVCGFSFFLPFLHKKLRHFTSTKTQKSLQFRQAEVVLLAVTMSQQPHHN